MDKGSHLAFAGFFASVCVHLSDMVFEIADKCRYAFYRDRIKSRDKHPARLCQPSVQFLNAYFAKQIEPSAARNSIRRALQMVFRNR